LRRRTTGDLRRTGTGTYGSCPAHAREEYGLDPSDEEPTSPVYAGETGMKSNLKWHAMRGLMLLASSAAAFGFFVDHARRW